MQIPCDPLPLREPLVHAPAQLQSHLPNSETVCRINKTYETKQTNHFEPNTLRERRWDRKCKLCPTLIPDSVVVACDHTKAIGSRWQVGVKRLPANSRFLPGRVSSFEPVAETHFLRVDETQRSVIDLHIAQPRRKNQSVVGLIWFAVHENFLNLNGWNNVILRQVRGIEDLQHVPIRDPKAAIRCPRHRIEIGGGPPASAPSKASN